MTNRAVDKQESCNPKSDESQNNAVSKSTGIDYIPTSEGTGKVRTACTAGHLHNRDVASLGAQLGMCRIFHPCSDTENRDIHITPTSC